MLHEKYLYEGMWTKSHQYDQLEDKDLFSQKLPLPTSLRTMLLKFFYKKIVSTIEKLWLISFRAVIEEKNVKTAFFTTVSVFFSTQMNTINS